MVYSYYAATWSDRALVVKNLLYRCSLSKNCLNTFTRHKIYCLQVGIYCFLITYILIFIYIYNYIFRS